LPTQAFNLFTLGCFQRRQPQLQAASPGRIATEEESINADNHNNGGHLSFTE
jgi:hypothetical protein